MQGNLETASSIKKDQGWTLVLKGQGASGKDSPKQAPPQRRCPGVLLQSQSVLWLPTKLPTAHGNTFKIRRAVGPILELPMPAICSFVEALHSSGVLLQPNPETGLNLPLCSLQNYTQLPGKQSPILFISFSLPAMKLRRKPVGAFCCLVAEMCNFWKCSSE